MTYSQIALYFAALVLAAVGVAHSVVGEKYVLQRLFRRPHLPKLLGSPAYMMRTLRFAWHVTTIAWWGLAAILVLLAAPSIRSSTVGAIIGVTFLAHFVIVLAGSRGRHLAWIAFLVVGALAIYGTR